MGAFGDLSKVASNIQALQALNSLDKINNQLGIHQLRLATGRRINTAADDSAGFVIGRGFQARVKGLTQSLANVGDAKSMLAIAESGLHSVLDILETMKEKATQAASDTLGSTERNAIEDELDDLAAEIDSILTETTFNGQNLLGSTALTIHTGEGTTDRLSVTVSSTTISASQIGVSDTNLTVSSASNASNALGSVNTAITSVKNNIANIGSFQARLSTKESTISAAITNTEASRSRIMDADFAREQLSALKLQIMQQTATASLAQANAAPQIVLSLFG